MLYDIVMIMVANQLHLTEIHKVLFLRTDFYDVRILRPMQWNQIMASAEGEACACAARAYPAFGLAWAVALPERVFF